MSKSVRYCTLVNNFCDVETNLDNPSCFIAVSFNPEMEKALDEIVNVIEECGLRPLIAKDNPPEFLMHNICKKICSSIFGVFEITESNEGVFTEYGMMLAQGKPAILAFDARAQSI